jgi:protein-disulfide isomerase
MREFVVNKQYLDASLLARCKGDKYSYLKLTEHLLLNQETWGFSKKYRENLFAIAAKYGISKDQYNECLNDETKAQILIDYAKLVGLDKDFIGTPSFYINGKLYQGEYTTKAISGFIETVLSKEENE